MLFDVFNVLGVYTPTLSAGRIEVRDKFVVGGFQIFGDDPALPDDGNKVSVSFPARDNMKMQMPGNAGPRTLPQVESHIEPIGLVDLLQNLLTPAGQVHDFVPFRSRCIGEGGYMPVGNDHQVACGVGESIQNEEGVLLAKQDETLAILISGGKEAKDAVRFLATRGEVVEAPGSP